MAIDYLKNISQLAAIGGWVIVSLFFMAQAAGYISSTDAKTHALLQQHDISLANHRLRQEDLIKQLTTALRVICENNSKSQAEHNNCLNISR